MTQDLNAEYYHNLSQIGETKQRVVRLFDAELILSSSVSDDHDEEEVTEDVPIKIVEIRRVGIEKLANDGGCILD